MIICVSQMFHKCTDGVLPCKDRLSNNDFRFLSPCSGPEKAIYDTGVGKT